MADDPFANDKVTRSDGFDHSAAVDLSSTDATLSTICRALWVGTAGDLKVQLRGDTAPVVIPSFSGWLIANVTKVFKTGTTASGIVAFW